MADYLQTLRMQNLFPGTEAPPANFGGMPTANQFGMDMPSSGGFGGNMNSIPGYDPVPLGGGNPYGMDEGYGMDFTGPMQGEGTSDYNIDQRMNQLYDPQYEQSDRLNTLLSGYPERPTPKTGWGGALQKIGAIAGGMTGGMDLYNEVMAPGHNTRVTDWKGQAGPTQQAAQIERQNNVNERQSAMGVISAELRNQAMQHKAKNDETRSRIAQQRADVYEFKSRNPNLEILRTKGGNVMAINPQTGEKFDLGVPSGSLTDADGMALAQKHKLEAIAETGEESRETEELKQRGKIELEGVKEGNRPPSPLGPGAKPEAPNQTRIRQVGKAREALNTKPEWAKFIKIEGNDFKILPPSEPRMGGFSSSIGPTPEQYKEIQKFIYGTPQPGAKITRTVKSRKTGEVKTQYSTDGGKNWLF